jgi:hypothetical protein
MNWKQIVFPLAGLALLALAWRSYGLPGLAVAATGLVMWALLHFTRLMHVLKQASDRPVGSVASAVMLNAKLRPRVNLLHVMAMTRSIGEPLSPPDTQPEVYRWTDAGNSQVTCEFVDGRLVKWTLTRPDAPADESAPGSSPAAP